MSVPNGMHGYSVGRRPFSVHGAFCLTSVRPTGTLQQWQFTIATVPGDDCQIPPAVFTWCIHRFTMQVWLSQGRENQLHRRLFERYVPFYILLYIIAPPKSFFSKTEFEKVSLLLDFCFLSFQRALIFSTVIDHTEHGECALNIVEDIGSCFFFTLSDGNWLCLT